MKSPNESTTSSLIDYAHPMLMAERKLKDAHSALLRRDFDKGIEMLLEASVEVKLAINSVTHMKEGM